jgi:hypothetical protein
MNGLDLPKMVGQPTFLTLHGNMAAMVMTSQGHTLNAI